MITEVLPIQVFLIHRQSDIDDAGPTNSLLVGYRLLRVPSTGVVCDEVAQDSQEVWHRLASAGVAAFDNAQRDARLRHVVGLTHQLGEPPPAHVTRPPQADRCAGGGHGRIDVRTLHTRAGPESESVTWPGLAQVCRLVHQTQRHARWHTEVHYK